MRIDIVDGTPATGIRLSPVRRRLRVAGVVQGVGFRPFVHRLATGLGLTGFVGNDAAAVFVEVQGPPDAVDRFERLLVERCPPLARITGVRTEPVPPAVDDGGFAIVPSRAAVGLRTLVPPDVATCDACLAELFDPGDRRYRHPFITCTDCGPRFTIIRDLPYDRPATTMAGFAMCPACAAEYQDPADRRYHAQPVACPGCGPTLSFHRLDTEAAVARQRDAAIVAAQQALAAGQVVAVKGIGGYHLACRADDAAAVARLRSRKGRGDKPFALLARDLAVAERLVLLSDDERRVLASPARPIVLATRRRSAGVVDGVAPGSPLLGVMLAYSPVHHLLLNPADTDTEAVLTAPDLLVMTSANLSDEPLCFDDADAAARLPLLADAVLGHDRPIQVPCDDSVLRVVDGAELPIRRSRGYAPLPVALGPNVWGPIAPAPGEPPRRLPRTLAVGGELKNTFCLTEGENAFCSAHLGDMGSLETMRAFERAVDQLTPMVAGPDARPQVLAADAHPGYLTRRWAERHGDDQPVLVQHHHAHVVSLLAEHGLIGEPVIGIAFDGTGYGSDGTVWGGEVLLLDRHTERFSRAGHLLPVGLPGGDGAVRNPCRMALSYLLAAGEQLTGDLPPVAACEPAELAAVTAQLGAVPGSALAAVPCSSAGRLFDAVASLLGVRHRVGYEAQAAIELEALAVTADQQLIRAVRLEPFGLTDGVIDHRPVIRSLVAAQRSGQPPQALALAFHRALAYVVARVAVSLCERTGIRVVGLTGGVFQNVLLLRACVERVQAAGLRVLTHRVVPPNDGGLSLGQAVVAALLSAGEEG